MELIGAFATGIAVFALLMALLPDRQRPTLGLRDRLRGWRRRRMAAAWCDSIRVLIRVLGGPAKSGRIQQAPVD